MNLPVVPKKSLGQNFLNSERVLVRIAETTKADKNDTVLEIGPGLGALTAKLLETAGKVVAVEKDDTLYSILCEKFAKQIKSGQLTLINQDIQDFDPKTLKKGYKLAANIPYNLTGLIIRNFLSGHYQPEIMVLLVQKEVVDRILAHDGKESLLSISVKVYGTPKRITNVARGNFNPVPRVDSAVFSVENISHDRFITPEFEELFFKVIHAGFGHKRKMLVRNLIDEKFGSRELWEIEFPKRSLKTTVRSEELTVDDWIFITNVLYNNH
jgi:16S rRNA (adenine1518-N6/adenine1519-N6)-dimethyltransferase